jgi:hypothetical protein
MQGFMQCDGKYGKTYTPVAQYENLCILLTLATMHDYNIEVMDVEGAFLHMNLMAFLSHTARPDISFTVHELSCHLNTWNKDHWKAVKRVLHYLWGTLNYTIVYDSKYYDKGRESPLLQAFRDSNHTSNVESRNQQWASLCYSNIQRIKRIKRVQRVKTAFYALNA